MDGTSWIEALAEVIAGLGLFFAGVWFLTENLKNITGARFRQAVMAWGTRPTLAIGGGAMVGAVSQSTSVAIFILASMLNAGFLTVEAAIPILVGANIGTSLLVFLASFDVRLIMLFAVGLAGIALTDERFIRKQWRPITGAVFGLSLLFLGLDTIQSGAVPIVQEPWAAGLLERSRESPLIGFLIGTVLTIIAQSAAAISILAITLADAGVFTTRDTILTIYGANFGAGIIAYILSAKLRGQARQLAAYQIAVINCFGTAVLLALYAIEMYADIPLVLAAVQSITDQVGQQMALVYLLLTATGLLLVPLRRPVADVLARISPPTQAESDSKPRYIHDYALQDPASAVELTMLEQRRLVHFFSRYFEALRDPRRDNAHNRLEMLHEAFRTLSGRIQEFVEQLGSDTPSAQLYERINTLLSIQRRLEAIEGTLYDLATTLHGLPTGSTLEELSENITEALDTVTLTLDEAVTTGDDFDLEMLDHMTGDRGDVLQRIRQTYLSGERTIDSGDKLKLLQITNLCERFLWLLGELQQGDSIRRIGHAYTAT